MSAGSFACCKKYLTHECFVGNDQNLPMPFRSDVLVELWDVYLAKYLEVDWSAFLYPWVS